MRDDTELYGVLRLLEFGLNDCQIARLTGVPRATVRDWRRARRRDRRFDWRVDARKCEVCAGRPPHPPEAPYAYLLGLYLGDGCISHAPRAYRLRIVLDAAYPRIIEECAAALKAVRPPNRVWCGRHGSSRCVVVSMFWQHWPCVLPQHGPGRKHLRQIVLQPWQEAIVSNQHRPFLRGLIHSDGCRVVANDRGVASIRYHFSNLSEDIKNLYCASLDELGIPWTRPSGKDIAVYRKSATAVLDEFIGPKR